MSTTAGRAPEQPDEEERRGGFSSRRVFILAAIGSAVGLGNIWRFPYVAYENGGGAFLLPYLIALLTAGIPFLLLDYAIGHRHRGSAPLSFARLRRGTEGLGWWQVGICFVIAVYYAAVIAWALRYTFFSLDLAWGDDPEGFFFSEFLQAGDVRVTADVVPGVLVPLALVWLAVLVVMALGVQRGIGLTSLVFIPVLVLAFVALVVQALLLPGAGAGLDALFAPDWSALTSPAVWAAAFGQIFFSLSVGFGIMITYASYVRRREDMVGSGLVVGFSNSGFELLAGIGVFAALGFMAQASGQAVDEVASGGIGLAFIAFPAIISEAPAGGLLGVLFFGALVIAGITSLISVIEVVISAVRDKLDTGRLTATLAVGVPAAVLSLVLFSTTSGIYVLDVVDHFVNQYGILVVALVSMLVVSWVVRALPGLGGHLNVHGRPRVGTGWRLLTSVVAPAGLAVVLVLALRDDLAARYEDYPAWLLLVLGWALVVALPLIGFLLARLPWRAGTHLDGPPPGSDPAAPLHAPATTDPTPHERRQDEGGPR
ncbi:MULTISPECIES: sodium-dependent transporter [unclassified Modestobacter]|uniref:sodium-dependent transporter n=1 Tax=unclassified Modestobacter TaxID=2643866 RepID=UPI0022AACEBB|nr:MULTISPECIES: sodium-dependent transporter [unclassified Modestobacter]MCZ2810179.1 sodium-dependent transporter [Modestobacter sp. VKM Ac-2979]MCZ2841665.1 sodium-dependent transporter [Modestobacter sp. VKM Ac-2980]MCZ2850270.1 sodium-dependent transporter [Modestobacter sp. VKM Ac-2978]